MPSPAAPILIVDDEKNTRDGLRMALEPDFEVYTAADLAGAEAILGAERIQVLVTDLRLGGESGMDLVESARRRGDGAVTIMMTAYGDVETAVDAMRRGAWHFVTKPLDLEELEALVRRASVLYARNRSDKATTARRDPTSTSPAKTAKPTKPARRGPPGAAEAAADALAPLAGDSPVIEQLRDTIRQVAPTRATVLIEGESGTGKELVARAVHGLSPRADQPLVAVHCAALSEQLLESELFGHEKGAFTGATNQRTGRFELADGGTLFLDEIGEIPPTTQVKLLRALGERTIERVGGASPILIDVRVVAATNRDLWQMVLDGDFREDLYYRLAVVRIDTPPLRERPGDVMLLAERFLVEFCTDNGLPPKRFSETVRQRLLGHRWPGNVRELRTVVEHAVVMSRSELIEVDSLPSSMAVRAGEPPPRIPPPRLSDASPDSARQASAATEPVSGRFDLREQERRLIDEALAATGGNRTQAAKLLGISRRTLQRKLGEEN